MNRAKLVEQIKTKRSVLCVGLDTDVQKLPKHLLNLEDPVFEFNKAIIDATAPYAVALKPNLAFYEALGLSGWMSLDKTMKYVQTHYPELFTIADAKRGDIGNTSRMYAEAFLNKMGFDSVTVAPYMGKDSVEPFLIGEGKWAIVLGHTSNPGALDFQNLTLTNGGLLHEEVLAKVATWGTDENIMFVIGATRAEEFARIRKIIPNHFLLVPGVGAQGGDLEGVLQNGLTDDAGLLINSSRGIIYASNGEDFAQAAAREAEILAQQMSLYL